MVGQFPLYYLGRAMGQDRLHRLADRYGKWLTVSGKDIDRAADWLRRHGPVAVLLARMVPGVRSFISIPAGASHMNLLVFTAYSTIGITIWSALLAALGYLLGDNYQLVEDYLGPIGKWLAIIVGIALLGWFGWRIRGCITHAKADCPLRDNTDQRREHT
jgi:membrane protein DedA with SNARE-associated domain